MSFRLTRCSRLTTQQEYSLVFNKPLSFSGTYWHVLAKDTGQLFPRLGLIVAKRLLQYAVDRNIYKRIAREVFRLNQSKLSNMDFVIMARKKIWK